jgi:hypothetical protein
MLSGLLRLLRKKKKKLTYEPNAKKGTMVRKGQEGVKSYMEGSMRGQEEM